MAMTQLHPVRPEGARLFGAAEALRESVNGALIPDYRKEYEVSVAAARAALGADAFGMAWAEGRAMSLEEAIPRALEARER